MLNKGAFKTTTRFPFLKHSQNIDYQKEFEKLYPETSGPRVDFMKVEDVLSEFASEHAPFRDHIELAGLFFMTGWSTPEAEGEIHQGNYPAIEHVRLMPALKESASQMKENSLKAEVYIPDKPVCSLKQVLRVEEFHKYDGEYMLRSGEMLDFG